MTAGAGGTTRPSNRTDAARFGALSPEDRERVTARTIVLYDGTRTIAACWHTALSESAPVMRLTMADLPYTATGRVTVVLEDSVFPHTLNPGDTLNYTAPTEVEVQSLVIEPDDGKALEAVDAAARRYAAATDKDARLAAFVVLRTVARTAGISIRTQDDAAEFVEDMRAAGVL